MSPRARTTPAELSITRALSSGVPSAALAVYARWWQLETWLRQLLYVELKAKRGVMWSERLPGTAVGRWARDTTNAYMASPDAENPLAYLDASHLAALIDTDDVWPLFEPSLLPRVRWRGMVDELMALRHRGAHCRRPHADDLARLEQGLRDLEAGARRALVAFNVQRRVWVSEGDPVSVGWVAKQHEDAKRLVLHAAQNYDTEFELMTSSRPWATDGLDGRLWHAEWRTREAMFDLRRFWNDRSLDDFRELVLFASQSDPSSVSISFTFADDQASVSNAIGACFDSLLLSRLRNPDALAWDSWGDGFEELDYRLQANNLWSLLTADAHVSVFGA